MIAEEAILALGPAPEALPCLVVLTQAFGGFSYTGAMAKTWYAIKHPRAQKVARWAGPA